MNAIESNQEGLLLFEPVVCADEREFFLERLYDVRCIENGVHLPFLSSPDEEDLPLLSLPIEQ